MIELRAGVLRLCLDPETGGAIASFTHDGKDVLRPVADPRLAAQNGRAVAGYPLIPYANRIAWGRFSFGGQTYQLARNFGDHPHSIHGNAWMRRWTVAEVGLDHARLVLDHNPPSDPPEEWPFAYRAELQFALAAQSLQIAISLENRDARPWPAGLGLHPYVARTALTTLRFEADTLWTSDSNSLPQSRVAVQGDAEFARGKLLGATEIDACYAGWGGSAVATVQESGRTLTLAAGPPLDHLQLYTPAGRDFFGLEPVSNMPDAVNRIEADADQGLRILAPAETMHALVTIGVTGPAQDAP